jgi:lysophospholipase L1-like esterase
LYAIQHGRTNLDLDLADFHVHYLGQPGMRIPQLSFDHVLDTVSSISPQMVVIDIGTNDLEQAAVNASVSRLFLFARKLVYAYGVQHVIFLQVLHRGMGRHAPTHPRRFARQVDQFNLKVKNLCSRQHEEQCQLHFWAHSRMHTNQQRLLLPDGVHLNPAGLFRYFHSLKHAITHHAHWQ